IDDEIDRLLCRQLEVLVFAECVGLAQRNRTDSLGVHALRIAIRTQVATGRSDLHLSQQILDAKRDLPLIVARLVGVSATQKRQQCNPRGTGGIVDRSRFVLTMLKGPASIFPLLPRQPLQSAVDGRLAAGGATL